MAKGSKGLCGPSAAEQKDWEAESDLRTLVEAEKIKGDPERLKRAMAKKKDQLAALKAAGE